MKTTTWLTWVAAVLAVSARRRNMFKHTILVAAVAGLVLAMAPAGSAVMIAADDPLVTTLGLSPGDTFHLVFDSSTATQATSTDIGYYNTFVNGVANGAGSIVASYGWTWKAIASTAGTSAIDNTGTQPANPGNPIYRVGDYVLVANDYADLWDGTIQAGITTNEKGGAAGSWTWTGTGQNGIGVAGAELGTAQPRNGMPSITNYFWINRDWDWNYGSYPMMGISEAVTVIPEPASFSLLGIVGLVLVARRRRRG